MNFIDRLACAFLGLVTGAIYGTLLAIAIGFATTGQFHVVYVLCTGAVFAAIGFLGGPKIGDVIAGTVHFVYGLFAGILSGAASSVIDPEPHDSGAWRNLFLFGLGTGIAVFLAWYSSR